MKIFLFGNPNYGFEHFREASPLFSKKILRNRPINSFKNRTDCHRDHCYVKRGKSKNS